MQAEIDRIIAIAADPSAWDAGDADFDSMPLRKRRLAARNVAQAIRDALSKAGYVIVLDEAQLLEKGEKLFKPVPTLPNDIFESIAQVRRDIDEVTGISSEGQHKPECFSHWMPLPSPPVQTKKARSG